MNTMKWQDSPPTHEEWSSANNEGFWWIKTTINAFESDGALFPETYIYEVVRLGLCIDTEKDNLWDVVMKKEGGHLSFNLHGKSYNCKDFHGVQWQPVMGHSDKNTLRE